MNHEFLNGDATKEIIKDNSIDLFLMWPPYMGVDVKRYGHTFGQLNNIGDTYIFSKRLAKIAKNCEKALREGGHLLYILPVGDPTLIGNVFQQISKKTKLQYCATMIWSYRDILTARQDLIDADYCHVLWFSKGTPKVDMEYLKNHSSPILFEKFDHKELEENYGQLGHVSDALPVKVAEHYIKLLTAPGDTVANVLGGTGSVSVAAENTGRDSVYNDISYVQLTIAKKRMEDIVAEKKKRTRK